MSRIDKRYKDKNEAFICKNCGKGVLPAENGTSFRNHCPGCLWSMHVDLRPGDRMSVCRGMMEPIGIWVKRGDEPALIHRCVKCGSIKTNRVAGDDSCEDMMNLAYRPLKILPNSQNPLQTLTDGADKAEVSHETF